MLQAINGPQITTDDYYIQHMKNGLDELHFSVHVDDPTYSEILEEDRILETTEQKTYRVVKISGGTSVASFTGQLDLSDFQRLVFYKLQDGKFAYPGFAQYNKTEVQVLEYLMDYVPGDWTLDVSAIQTHRKHTIEMQCPTVLDVLLQMQKTFGVAMRFSTSDKRLRVFYPDEIALSNSYAVDSVNLRGTPEYKGSTDELFTRIYPSGKNGLTIADAAANTRKTVYIDIADIEDHPYLDRKISKIWSDERYEDADSLYAAALEKLKIASRPAQSWTLPIVDLYRIYPEMWPNLQLDIWTRLRFVDSKRKTTTDVQVKEDKVWPYYPEKNVVSVSTVAVSTQRTVRSLRQEIQDPNSEFQQKQKVPVTELKTQTKALNTRTGTLETKASNLQNKSVTTLSSEYTFINEIYDAIDYLGGWR